MRQPDKPEMHYPSTARMISTYRRLMELKQKDIATIMDIQLHSVENMELGRSRCMGKPRERLIKVFDSWRDIQLNKLESEIKYLKSI